MILLLMMQSAYDLFYELFLSVGMFGYFGPIGVVLIGYVVAKHDANLGVVWFVVECLMIAQYLALVDATPDYWWQVIILLIGGISTCVFPAIDR